MKVGQRSEGLFLHLVCDVILTPVMSLPDTKSSAPSSSLDEETLVRLVEVLSVNDVSWRNLAEKLGMKTLTHLYQESETPCHHLLQHYKVTYRLESQI